MIQINRRGSIAMIHIGRCGSTVVGKMLNCHPHICWAGEVYTPIFRKWKNRNGGVETVEPMPGDAVKILKRNRFWAFNRYYGFEIKPFHFRLIGYTANEFIDQLKKLGITHYILLDRENKLRKIVSSLIAHQNETTYFVSSESDIQLTRVHVDCRNIAIDFEEKPSLRSFPIIKVRWKK